MRSVYLKSAGDSGFIVTLFARHASLIRIVYGLMSDRLNSSSCHLWVLTLIQALIPEPKPNILCLTSKCKRILFSIPAFRDRISGGRKKSSPRNTIGKPAWSEKVFRESPQKSRWIARLARKSIPVRVGTG